MFGNIVARFVCDAELAIAQAKIDAAYWAFTRQKRARPPVLVVPDAYRDRRELEVVRFWLKAREA